MMHGCGYSSNISLSRLRDHRQVANAFSELARRESQDPDIVVAALPTIELCAESVRFGLERGVPVLLDMRDMWPDIFVDSAPGPARPIARLMLRSMFSECRRACREATAIIGITDEFVDWGLKRGDRSRTDLDRAFPFAFEPNALEPEQIAEAGEFWDKLGIAEKHDDLVACFFGTMGRQLDIETVIRAAKELHARSAPVRFVMCGVGDRLAEFREMARDCPNVVFPGWVAAAQIRVLMSRSSVGLDPLPGRYDFLATINNKALEYISAGLPVISSPREGVLYRLLKENECGLSYEHGDAQGLAACLHDLWNDPNKRGALAAGSTRLFSESFTFDRVYGSMMQHLMDVAGTPRVTAQA